MSKKNGFTLVELMVVIVIIGVLAAVAIPKMMAATNKAKASEGPQILGTIANMQAAFSAEHSTFVECQVTTLGEAVEVDEGDGWSELGFTNKPNSRYFVFNVEATGTASSDDALAALTTGDEFKANATLSVPLGVETNGAILTINNFDKRDIEEDGGAKKPKVQALVPNWR